MMQLKFERRLDRHPVVGSYLGIGAGAQHLHGKNPALGVRRR